MTTEQRLARLEMKNRRLYAALAATLVALAGTACAAFMPSAGIVTASEFDLVRDGSVVMTIRPGKSGPSITTADGALTLSPAGLTMQSGAARTLVTPGFLSIASGPSATTLLPTRIATNDGPGGASASITSNLISIGDASWSATIGANSAFGANLNLLGPDGRNQVTAGLSADSRGAHLELTDNAGFILDAGNASTLGLTDGAVTNTSAASIVMFGNDKDHKVIWKVPQ